jgi:hypothetical protein
MRLSRKGLNRPGIGGATSSHTLHGPTIGCSPNRRRPFLHSAALTHHDSQRDSVDRSPLPELSTNKRVMRSWPQLIRRTRRRRLEVTTETRA